MSLYEKFLLECGDEISLQGVDSEISRITSRWKELVSEYKYTYHFKWLGRPIIQYPQDIVAMQELIWEVKPDLIIETGIAHGGSLLLSASMLAMIELCEATEKGDVLDPVNPKRWVVGVDVDIRPHNRKAIEGHPMSKRINMIEGSAIDSDIVSLVYDFASQYNRILVFLDSNHTHAHVIAELNAYAGLVSKESYCVVFDTAIEDRPFGTFSNRPWDKGNNPKTAVLEYLKEHDEFVIDKEIENKLLITVAPDGFLRRIG